MGVRLAIEGRGQNNDEVRQVTPEIFLDWYVRLAAEGETMLIVWQKTKSNGDYTYIAMMPDRWKPDRAMYGNTGVFLPERFEAGKPAARAAYIERVAVLVLDDIGTKSRVPSLEPTWKMETSPGNQQWGYVFGIDDQPDKPSYAAAINAIVEAKYTDPGMTNPVRNFRLPGSVNLKPSNNGFQARLIEWHREREFTLPQICDALGVVPGDPIPEIRYTTLPDDGGDIVVKWLSEQHLILSPPNSSGWMGVQCPNCDQHSDGNLEGRYNPATRSYRCMHGHCTDWTSTRYLDWIAEQGGPKAMRGLRQELMATAMASALAAVKPTEAYPDATAEAVAEVERQELGRLDKAQWFERFAYVQSDDSFFDLKTRAEVPRHVFNALYRAVKCQSVHKDASGNGRRIEASICFDENRQSMGAKVLEGITFAAGESALVAREGWVYGNRWRNARPQPVPGDVSPWLAHAERMIPDPIEREHVFNVMAHKIQFPAIKINHAVLHAGKPGSGKDTLWAPMLWAIGGPRHVNVWQMKNEELQSQWGYGLESEVMVIQELRQPEAKDRRALENHLKPIIAAPPEMLPVNRKGLHPYEAVNRVFVLGFSNERAAITLPSDDRRWMVIWSEAPRMEDAAARALWGWYKGGGFAHVAAWLHARDVSAFSPGAAPPFTEAKAIMIESSLSTAESFLVDMMRSRVGEFTRGVIGSPFHAVCDRVSGALPSGVKVPQAALFHALREAGWIDMGRAATPEHQTKKHLFCAPELAHLAKAELRRMVEQPAGPFTVVQGGRAN
jgi:hypothetical protein